MAFFKKSKIFKKMQFFDFKAKKNFFFFFFEIFNFLNLILDLKTYFCKKKFKNIFFKYKQKLFILKVHFIPNYPYFVQ